MATDSLPPGARPANPPMASENGKMTTAGCRDEATRIIVANEYIGSLGEAVRLCLRELARAAIAAGAFISEEAGTAESLLNLLRDQVDTVDTMACAIDKALAA